MEDRVVDGSFGGGGRQRIGKTGPQGRDARGPGGMLLTVNRGSPQQANSLTLKPASPGRDVVEPGKRGVERVSRMRLRALPRKKSKIRCSTQA